MRDHFAGLAMQTLMTLDQGQWTPDEIAAAAYSQADAMVEERERAIVLRNALNKAVALQKGGQAGPKP